MKKILWGLALLPGLVFASGFFGGGGGGGGSIGGSVVGGLDCSILFVHPNAILAQDQANLCWDAGNVRLGIGTSSPSTQLHTTGGVRFAAFGSGIAHFGATGVLSSSPVVLTSEVSGILPLANGGTNKNFTASAGAIVYSDADSFEASAVGSSGQLFQSAGSSAPGWTTATFPSTASSTGTILRANGTNWVATTATYPATGTANELLYTSASNVFSGLASGNLGALITSGAGVPSITTSSSDGQILRRSSSTIAFGSIDLASSNAVGATILNVANGGTGLASGTSGGIPFFSASNAISSSALLAANAIVLGGGAATTPATLGSLGTTTTVLHGNAAGAPSFAAVSLTADISGTLALGNGGTGFSTYTKGDIIYSSATNTLAKLAVGTEGQVLNTSSTGIPSWSIPRKVTNSRGSPGSITALGGITSTASVDEKVYVQGSGGAVVVTANPQISAGSTDGQELCVVGRSDTNTLTLSDGTGLVINGAAILGADNMICLSWDGTNWVERSRNF